jgi:hypothetical protein
MKKKCNQEEIEKNYENNMKSKRKSKVTFEESKEIKKIILHQQPLILAQLNDLSNHNIIENKKTKVNNTLKLLREFKSKPRYKDKYGNNVKQHFGIYKYFINT